MRRHEVSGMKTRFELKIKELEKKYRIVTNNLIDIVWVVDADTLTFEYLTPSIKSLTGFSAEELAGRTIHERMMPASLKKALSAFQEEREKFEKGVSAIRALELELIHKNRSTYWVEIRSRFVKERDKVKIVGITRDITERKQAERQRERLIEKLGRALAEKERLLKENKVLRGLLPICSGCRRIRDDHDRWWPLEAYVKEHSETDFTHTICPDCRHVFYPDLDS